MQATEEERCRLVVVGAGLAALHVLSRLPDSLRRGTVVVDSSGAWLADWVERHGALATTLLRTPAPQNPHPSPLALRSFAEKRGRQAELVPVARGFAPVPSLPLFLDFCAAKVVGALPPPLRTPRADTVVRLELLGGSGGDEDTGCRIHLASGRVLLADAAVYTPAGLRPVVPAWARQLAPPPPPATPVAGLVEAAASSAAAAAAAAQEPTAEHDLPCLPPGILTAGDVDLRGAELAGRRVAVVGGGMAAGLLAAGAAERGAAVTLICRRPLRQQPFDTDVGWWGAKQLNGFRQLDSPAARIRACRRARGQGSVHLPVWRRLVQAATGGRLTVLEGWEVASAEPEPAAEGPACGSSTAWVLRAVRYCSAAAAQKEGAPPAPSAFQQAVAAAAAAAAARECASPAPAAAAATPDTSGDGCAAVEGAPEQQVAVVAADAVWLACGRAHASAADPVLRQLAAAAPVRGAGGYAWLDDEHLCWPGAAVYLAGRAATLSLGPAAGDMPGMRLAADRIAASLARLGYAEERAWHAARSRLRAQLGCQGGSGGKEAERALLAAAVSQEAAAGAPFPLEAEGVAFEEAPPRARVAKPDDIIDVSDLDPQLPRRELQQYKFIDDEFELTVVLQLEEAVPLDRVRVLFGERALEVWAVGAAAAYHLHVPRLYGRVIVKKCRAKVNQKARKLYLLLRKDSDAEWRFLKG